MSDYFRPKGRKAKYVGDKPTPLSFRVMPEQKAGLMRVAVELGYSNYSDLLKEVVDNIISDNGAGMDKESNSKMNELYTFLSAELMMLANIADGLEDKLAECQGALMIANEEIERANSNAFLNEYKKPSYKFQKIDSESDEDQSENAQIFLAKIESTYNVESIDNFDLEL